jgi:hypothetical protein
MLVAPVLRGAVQLTSALAFPAVASTFSGALGYAAGFGVTAFVVAAASDGPLILLAVIEKVYDVVDRRFGTVNGELVGEYVSVFLLLVIV